MINEWHIKMDENKGGGFESLQFHPVHVNAAFWSHLQNCLLKLNVKVKLC